MQTKQVELYVEKIRSGILVEGTIDNDYVEVIYKYVLNHPDDLLGNFKISGLIPTIARSYGTLKDHHIENNDGLWKSKGRKKITDEMYMLIGIIENFLQNNGFAIIE